MNKTTTRILYTLLMTLNLTLTACDEEPEGTIWGGAYQSTERPDTFGAGLWLDVDVEKEQIILTYPDGDSVTLDCTVRPKSEWPDDCPTETGSTLLEAWDLAVDALEIDGTEIGSPYLTGGCFREDLYLNGTCVSGDICTDMPNVRILFTSMDL